MGGIGTSKMTSLDDVTCVTELIFSFSVTSISGDTIGQIKLGLAPSIQTPRTFTRRVQPEKSISLQSNLAALQPEKLEQSNKNLHTQLKELDDLGIRFITRFHPNPYFIPNPIYRDIFPTLTLIPLENRSHA